MRRKMLGHFHTKERREQQRLKAEALTRRQHDSAIAEAAFLSAEEQKQ